MELWRRWSGQQDDGVNGPLDDASIIDPTKHIRANDTVARSSVSPPFVRPQNGNAIRAYQRPISLATSSDFSHGTPLEKIQKKIHRFATEERNLAREEQRIAVRLQELHDREKVLRDRMQERKQTFKKTIDQSSVIVSRLKDREEDLADALLSLSLQIRERKLAIGPMWGELEELRSSTRPHTRLLEVKQSYAAALREEINSAKATRVRRLTSRISALKKMKTSLRTQVRADRDQQKNLIETVLSHARDSQVSLTRGIATDRKRQWKILNAVHRSALDQKATLIQALQSHAERRTAIRARFTDIATTLNRVATDVEDRQLTISHLLQLREERLREIADSRLGLLARQQRHLAQHRLLLQSTRIVQEERRLQGLANKVLFAESAKQRKYARLKTEHLRLLDQRRKRLIALRDLLIRSEPTSELSDLSLLIKSLEERSGMLEKELARFEKNARKTMVRWKDLRRELLEELILQETFSPAVAIPMAVEAVRDHATTANGNEEQSLSVTSPTKDKTESRSWFAFWKNHRQEQSPKNQTKKKILVAERAAEPTIDEVFAEPLTLPIRVRHLAQDWIPKQAFVFASITTACVLAIIGLGWVGKGSYLQARVMNQAQSALASLLAGKDALGNKSYDEAVASFIRADRGFSSSEKLLAEFSPLAFRLASVLPQGKQIESGKALLAVGKNMATAGTALSHIAERFDGSPIIAADTDGHVQVTLSLFDESLKDIATATQAISEASVDIARVNTDVIPDELQPQVQELKDALPIIAGSLRTFSSQMDSLMKALGKDRQKRYLVFLQNPTEMRATGGFPGTYALIDVDNGAVVHMDVNGIYDPANQFPDRLRSFRPDQILSETLTLQDANWWPDAPTSAKKMQEMWERAGGPSVDGVLFINATTAIDLLRVTGPLTMPSYDATLSADNFYDVLQHEVEVQYDKSLNRPKQILTDAVPLMLQRLNHLTPTQQKDVMGLMVKWLTEKDMQIVLNDEQLQSIVRSYGWAGEIQTAFEGDRLTVTSLNYGGNKSDRDIADRLLVVPTINGDGTVDTEVTLTRTHTGVGLWPSGVNSSYIRFTVPEHAQLISVSGFAERDYAKSYKVCKETCKDDPDVQRMEQTWTTDPVTHTDQYLDHGSRVFGNWLAVAPGEEKTVTIRYRQKDVYDLPWYQRIGTYQLLVQKQSGTTPVVTILPKAGAGLRLVEFVPQDQITAQPLTSDRVYGVVLERTWP